MLSRRSLLNSVVSVAAARLPLVAALPYAGRIMTVQGPVAPAALGLALPHEHVMSIFGADPAEPVQYDTEQLLAAVVPYLRKLRGLGCRAIFDCTAAYFGRSPRLLRRISEQSGLHLVTNTGYYGAANDRYVPAHAYEESADQLAARWIAEWRDGIVDGIRPGFLKIGVDPGPLSAIDRKLIQAAARTHRATGLTIAVHTQASTEAARDQLGVLREEGVSPRAWIWTHANAVKDVAELEAAAEQGAWLSFDGLSRETLDRHRELVLRFRKLKRLGQVLLSHDGNSFRPKGAPMRPYEALFTEFLPLLRREGLSQEELQQMMVRNPQRAFAIAVRSL